MNQIELFTQVNIPPMPFAIDFSTSIVSLGSCFSDEIGSLLQASGFNVDQNAFGTLYNPASIAAALRRIIYDVEIGANDLVHHEGLWHSWHHHGSFSRPTLEECLAACNSRLHEAHESLKQASLLLLTFGTAWTYSLKSDARGEEQALSRQPVANCHKVHPDRFVRSRMTVDDIVGLWRPLLHELHACFPTLNVLFTVSPIRHLGDGAHDNQLSKSTLLLAVDQLVEALPSSAPRRRKDAKEQPSAQGVTAYFPAYELLLDELRDYRFYDADMAHPSPLAVEIVWERFQSATMTPAVRNQAHLNRKRHKRALHVSLHY